MGRIRNPANRITSVFGRTGDVVGQVDPTPDYPSAVSGGASGFLSGADKALIDRAMTGLGISADRGDANVTLTLTDYRIQRFGTKLTANRTITLPATGAEGARFIIRRDAYGAFTLDVGGLKAFPANTSGSIEVAWDGSAWQVVRSTYGVYDYMGAIEKPSAALSETFARTYASSAAVGAATSGRLLLHTIPLLKGMVVSSITFVSGSTAIATPSNQWFSLYSPTLALLGTTADDTTAAWGQNIVKTLSLSSPVTITSDGLYYVGFVAVASTMPTFTGIALSGALGAMPPILVAQSTTGLTNPASAPNPAGALSSIGIRPYAYVS